MKLLMILNKLLSKTIFFLRKTVSVYVKTSFDLCDVLGYKTFAVVY